MYFIERSLNHGSTQLVSGEQLEALCEGEIPSSQLRR